MYLFAELLSCVIVTSHVTSTIQQRHLQLTEAVVGLPRVRVRVRLTNPNPNPVACVKRTAQGEDSKLILAIKVETRHAVERQFGRKFPAICNQCTVMMAWSRKSWKLSEQFLRFLKRPLAVKFSKFCSQRLHDDTDWRCCVQMTLQFSDGESMKSFVIYLTKIFGCLNLSLLCGLRPTHGQPPTMYSQCSRFHLNRFTFSGVIAERRFFPRRVCPWFDQSYASLRANANL